MYKKELSLITSLEKLKEAEAKAKECLSLTKKTILVAAVESARALSKEFLSRMSKISPNIL